MIKSTSINSKNIITKNDVINCLNKRPNKKYIRFSKYEIEMRVKITSRLQAIVKRLKESQNKSIMLNVFNEVDMTEIMNIRKKYHDILVKFHDTFFAKATVQALKEISIINAEIDDNYIVYKYYYNLRIVASTPYVPFISIIRDVEILSTSIINHLQSVILAMHDIIPRPIAIKNNVEVRPMMYISNSYDYIIVDRNDALRFLLRIKQMLENLERILLI